MNLGGLSAQFEAHKVPILAAAGAAVVGLALVNKKKSAGDAGAGIPGIYSAGGQVARTTGGAAYDSSASDLYGAIQPQLESLGGQLTNLNNRINQQGTPPTPVPAGTSPAEYWNYTVKPGDTLQGIASGFGINGDGVAAGGWRTLYAYGPNAQTIGGDATKIQAGQVIRVPTPYGAYKATH